MPMDAIIRAKMTVNLNLIFNPLFTLPAACLLAVIACLPASAEIHKAHAITLYGEAPKYGENFTHFDYVDPDAPKGGMFRTAPPGEATFDSFNPYISKGNAVSTGAIESLMISSADEPSTMYGLIAETIEWPDDRSWAIFNLDPNAKWHDGKPIIADDVIWSFNTLIEKGIPAYRFYYASVDKVEKLGERRVKFSFKEKDNKELPLSVASLSIFPKHYWADHDFTKTTLEPPLGSGPYRVKDFESGRYMVQERVENYWAMNHPTQMGMNNFAEIRTEFFRDITALRLALKSGRLDFLDEHQAKAWALEYEIDAVKDGLLVKERVAHQQPQGMQGTVLNTRRELFKDSRVREAIGYAFDFEWANKNLFFSQYTRTDSYFVNTPLAATGLPQGKELEILEEYRGEIPERVFTEKVSVPITDGSGWARGNLRKAFSLLESAGWTVKDQKLVNTKGEQFEFELLLRSQGFIRIMLPWVRNLRRLGMDAKLRLVDNAQWINRVREFDFDAMVIRFPQIENPGNEQRDIWKSDTAEVKGSRNYAGIKSAVVDELVEELILSPDRETVTAYTKALDRLLIFGFYVVPNWYLSADRLLYWNKFSRPIVPLKNGTMTSRWWFDSDKAQQLKLAMNNRKTDQTVDETEKPQRPWWFLIAVLLLGGWMLMRYFSRSKSDQGDQ
jgi:microcin C transport system substrate-binding protein